MALQKLVENFARDWNENKLPIRKMALNESTKKILIENSEKQILEGYIVPIWKLDTENLNGRIYPSKLGERIVKESPTTLMLADHPENSDGSVKDIIGVTKSPFIQDKVLYAECYIVDQEFKEKLDKLISLGSGVGLSSSGLGSLDENNTVIAEDLLWRGWRTR